MALVQIEETAVEEYQKAFAEIEDQLEAAHNKIIELEDKVKFYQEQIADKSKIIISKKWHKPEITVEYNYSGVRIHTSAEDYIKSLVRQAEIDAKPDNWKKYVNWHFPDAEQIEAMLLPAAKKIEEEMKQSTVYFTPPIMTGE
jgi:frataxin-like iron-binding protein CyaY